MKYESRVKALKKKVERINGRHEEFEKAQEKMLESIFFGIEIISEESLYLLKHGIDLELARRANGEKA